MPPTCAQADAPAGLPIRYPTTLIDARWLSGAQRLLLRPVLPQDESLLSTLVLAQSAKARRDRFHGMVKPGPDWFRKMSQVDYQQQVALVVTSQAGGAEQLVADARYCVADDGRSAEFALMVDERWQRQGIGRWALMTLQQVAADAGLCRLEGEVLPDNLAMLALAQRCGFARLAGPHDQGLVQVRRCLSARHTSAPSTHGTHRPPGLWQRLGYAVRTGPQALWRAPRAH